jgi:catechol-2,3-dioxygenase
VDVTSIFEAHLEVVDMDRMGRFYEEVIGLRPWRSFAASSYGCAVTFLRVGPGVLGLWAGRSAVGTRVPLTSPQHIAFEVPYHEFLGAVATLRCHSVEYYSLDGAAGTITIHCEYPSAAVYFYDPENNLLELITRLRGEGREDGPYTWESWHRMRERG